MKSGYYYPYPSPYYYYPSPNPNYTGFSTPPPHSTDQSQPYATLPPLKATVELPPLQVPLTPYHHSPVQAQAPGYYYNYWDPNQPCREPIPPSAEAEEPTFPHSFPATYQYPQETSQHQAPVLPRRGSVMRRPRSLRTYGADLPADSLNLAPRPVNWRHDYVPPHSTRSKFRPFSLRGRLGGDHKRYTLHALINYGSSSTHPIAYDLRRDPQTINIQYLNLPRYSNDLDWYQIATTPPMYELHLYHRKLPWTITVRATQTNGITIGDIFDQIYETLCTRVTRQDFYNAALSPSDREEITTAFYYRGALNSPNGMLRMDFLGFDVVFLGLAKGKNGLLEIKTGPATPP